MAKTQQAPPKDVELSRLLTVRGRKGAHEWLTTVLGVPVTLNFVRTAATKREIRSREVGGALMFTTQDLFDWAMSLTERNA
ncbi:hypothetical protein GBO17_02600 [Mycobacterium avium subsp. hominissuis]|uniref:hypothetical protein n=1 Tax=Mycobacterium avium TaxID=1764 RepID=UPI001CC46493|nr:hypothetical protein [Mycobacterium avium]MBZ4557646.1 hypothetical protein [Mycobacterium avium subsp. hominissuis]MBZ4567386.1 hypothetical protein [Mycobacterium avium subsp. hominissuis]MBZ4586222.1 hypothetical protein [Mycobacterium avium subsp. hominissuis]MBZ4624541.1 hypothetical protein [Mycobacterium avium subsp. hominissuis]